MRSAGPADKPYMAGETTIRDDWAPLRHVPGLDGLRGIAVILVVLYHGPWPGAEGGFIGVDLFFVLSGYLITRLLIDEWARSGRVAMGAFYRRRAVRLLPALFALVAVVWALALLFDTPRLETRLGTRTVWALSYIANWHDVVTQTHGGAFSHLWSSSVEEQFYAVWPILVAVGLRRRGLRFVQCAAVGGVVLTAVIAAARAWSGTPGIVLYFSTESHGVILLLAGSALGAFPRFRLSPEIATRLVTFGLIGLGALAVIPDRYGVLHARSGYLPIAIVSLALVAGVAGLPAVKALEVAPLTAVGRVSYGIYLWHIPMIWFGADISPDHPVLAAAVLTTIGVVASHKLVEQPAQRWRTPRRARRRSADPDRVGRDRVPEDGARVVGV